MAELISAAKADQVRADQALAMLRDGQHLAQQLGGGAGRAPARDATPDRQFADGQWLSKQTELAGREEVAAARPAATRFLLGQGTAIPAVSLSAINTQLPGDLVAQVSEDVYDNITGDVLLIPKGARLLGAYNSDVRQGQARVLVAFRRLIFPSGAYVDLGGTKGADAAGNAGFGGEVNHQALRTFGGSFLTAIFTGLLESRMQHNNSSVNVYAGSGSAQNAAGQVMVDTARRMNDRQSQVQPYIEVPRGYRFRIIVQKDMDLNPAVTGVHPR
jgi:type IV secretion system protein VirB10